MVQKKSNRSSRRIAIILASKDFRDEEYFIPKKILEETGFKIKTASDKLGLAIGAEGGEAKVDFLLSEVNPIDFEAVIFIGGPGCLIHLDNNDSYKIIKETVSQDKILAAICISPVILAKAGVLIGKKATVWSSPLNKDSIEILKNNGAEYLNQNVVVDGKIITANGPSAAEEFGKAILKSLTK